MTEEKKEEPKKEWKKPPHYTEVDPASVKLDPEKQYKVYKGKLFEVNYSDPEYKKWADQRVQSKKDKKLEKAKRKAEIVMNRQKNSEKRMKKTLDARAKKLARISEKRKKLDTAEANILK